MRVFFLNIVFKRHFVQDHKNSIEAISNLLIFRKIYTSLINACDRLGVIDVVQKLSGVARSGVTWCDN